MENSNSPEYLNKITAAVIDNLRQTGPAPSVQMQDVPRKPFGGMTDEEEAELDDMDEDENKDVRITPRLWDKSIENNAEFEPSDDENLAARNGVTRQNGATNRVFNDHGDDGESGSKDAPAGTANGDNKEAEDTVIADANDPNDDTIEDIQESTSAPAADAAKNSPKGADNDGDVDMADPANADDTPIKKEDAEPEAAPEPEKEADTKPVEETATAGSEKAEETSKEGEGSSETAKPASEDKPKEAEASDAMDVDNEKEKPAEEADEKKETDATS